MNKIPHEQLTADDKEQRWQDAEALADMHGLLCTGSADVADCPNVAALAYVLRGALIACVCREHATVVMGSILSAGHKNMKVVALVDMLDAHGDRFRSSVDHLRELRRTHGFPIGAYRADRPA